MQITIATNLAGRGTDILLGGNPKGLVQMLLENKLLGLMAPGKARLRRASQLCIPCQPLMHPSGPSGGRCLPCLRQGR